MTSRWNNFGTEVKHLTIFIIIITLLIYSEQKIQNELVDYLFEYLLQYYAKKRKICITQFNQRISRNISILVFVFLSS